jgi:hypothetical protein
VAARRNDGMTAGRIQGDPSSAKRAREVLVILATQEAEIRRIVVQSQPQQIVPKTLS